jgi:dTDP-4-dehydrorhamnose reductase
VKILILGSGQVATAVASAAPAHHEVVTRSRSQLDILDAEAINRTLIQCEPNWIVNAAAYTAVDLAEKEAAQAIAVNDAAVGALSLAALQSGSRLLHLSTDFVFDGQSSRAYLTSDRTHPLSVYGMSKLGGERHVLGAGPGIVLRTAWVYAATGKNFVLTMLRLMRERDQLGVVCDQIGSPTWAGSLAAAIWMMVDCKTASGIYHWTDLGIASWYDFAVAIQEEALVRGLLSRAVPILPIQTADYPTPAKRPAFSVLDTASTRAALNLKGQHWRHNLRVMLDELRAA